jgi:magnesium-transporting ATPase (P-type)
MELMFHQLPADEVLTRLQTDRNGLTLEEVTRRRKQYGLNKMPQPKSKSLAEIFFHQFLNPLIYVLMAAAVISLVTGDLKDAIFITAIILINSILGAYQERRAENSAQALRNLVKVTCRVKREGRISQVDSEELVPGDIVLLESGQKVPADLRLIEVKDLSVDEALLTGESVAVNKISDPLPGGADIAIGDRFNMAFAATTIEKGRATGIVTGTGLQTQIGEIADSLRSTETEKPPLVRRMEVFSKKISIVILLACVLLGIVGYLEGRPAVEIFFIMVAVGVSAIPEGLPVGLTVALSIGTRRMAKRNVIVRKLPAVEGLGSCTLIASDKTGTLTMDQQSVKKIYLPSAKKIYEVTGQGYNGEGEIMDGEMKVDVQDEDMHRLVLACVMANEGILRKTDEGWEHSGDAVDVAFRALAYKIGKLPKYFQDQVEVEQMIPYESENKFSGVFYRQKGQLHFAMKGAMEVIHEKIEVSEADAAHAITEQLASEGYRVLAVAGGPVDTTELNNLPTLDLYGLLGMIDPLRPEAKDSVDDCRQAGIEVVMVTGDHPSTALAISKQLGIARHEEETITGAELSALKDLPLEELGESLRVKKVFARVAPLQKQLIVEAKKSLGHFVAVTGDGVNDAPALKSAHIGVAMGGGTDLAKEASSIIITDNNFASIAAGVEEGRVTFDNLRKIIYLLISTGAAELLTIALALFTNIPLPFLAVQLLWLNLVTNGIQDIALAFEKGDKSVMQRPPRKPDESIFDKLMNTQILVSGVFIAVVVFALWYHLIYNLQYEELHARTVVMMLMVLLQNFHALNCRSETKSLFRIPLKNNYVLLGGIVLAQLVHISASYIPGLSTALRLDPISFNEWIKLLPTAASIFVVMELFKIWRRRRIKLKKKQA